MRRLTSAVRKPSGFRHSPRLAPLLAPLMLAGCITTAAPPSNEPTLVETRLMDSGQRIAAALEQIARTQSASAPRAPAPIDLSQVPEDLRRPITWPNWQGPIDAATRGVASRIGYKVLVHGVPPAVMPIVSIDANATPAVHVLESIGLQIGEHGTVRPDPNDLTIHLYFNPARSGVF